jgi:hypothetical protein
MLHTIGSTMGRAQYWRNYFGPTVPYMVCLLALIIPRQPQFANKAGLSAQSAILCRPDEDHSDFQASLERLSMLLQHRKGFELMYWSALGLLGHA